VLHLLSEFRDQIRESLTSAILLENSFLIEEALDQAPLFEHRIKRIEAHFTTTDPALERIQAHFYDYLKTASLLAHQLVTSSNDLTSYEKSASKAHLAFQQLNQSINQMLTDRQDDYSQQLNQINQSLSSTNALAALIGLAVIMMMLILTWWTTRRVVKAVTQADLLKESFLTTISHELRTPMNGIVGALSLLKDSKLNTQQEELLAIARDSSTNMTKMIDDILTLTDLMAGKPQLIKLPFTESDLTTELVPTAQNYCHYKALTLNYSSDLEGITLISDRDKLIIVCRQLLENAIKYTKEGEIIFRISHRITNESHAEGYLRIHIEDNGPGLSSQIMQDMFTPFTQEESGFKRSHQGIGIGLTMSKMLVKGLGGTLTLKNKPDTQGAIAELTIPCEFKPASQTSNQTTTQISSNNTSEAQTTNENGECILIVEDNLVNQKVLKKIVSKMNFQTLVAADGQEAITAIKSHPVDLILMDCQMPVMDGFEATQKIRQMDNKVRTVPIIAVTANARDSDKERCLKAGMDGFLSKPVNFQTVKKSIESYLHSTA
jgi:signal transduction histidine kinase/CheY-like chemotaxis protein